MKRERAMKHEREREARKESPLPFGFKAFRVVWLVFFVMDVFFLAFSCVGFVLFGVVAENCCKLPEVSSLG